METLKAVVVGDGTVGKTCLLMCYTQNAFPTEYVPTIFASYSANVLVDNRPINLSLNDTAGQEDYDRLRPLGYPGTKGVLICFSVDSRDSLINVEQRWLPEIKAHLSNVPFLLVGTKMDLRKDSADPNFVSTEEAKALAKKIGAARYIECSALTMMNVKLVFDTLIRVSLIGNPKQKMNVKKCRLL